MKKIALLFPLLFLGGCWKVKDDKLTLKYSLKTGAGSFTRHLNGLTCEEKGQDCTAKNSKDLEGVKSRYLKVFGLLGMKEVKADLKAKAGKKHYDSTVQGKFSSLSQLPFFDEFRSRFQEIPGNRTDQILGLHLKPKGEFDAGSFAFEFVSTDPAATIEEVFPEGKVDAGRRSVRWESLPAQSEPVAVRIRLKGYEMPK